MGSSVFPGASLEKLLGIPKQSPSTYVLGLHPAPTAPLSFRSLDEEGMGLLHGACCTGPAARSLLRGAAGPALGGPDA